MLIIKVKQVLINISPKAVPNPTNIQIFTYPNFPSWRLSPAMLPTYYPQHSNVEASREGPVGSLTNWTPNPGTELKALTERYPCPGRLFDWNRHLDVEYWSRVWDRRLRRGESGCRRRQEESDVQDGSRRRPSQDGCRISGCWREWGSENKRD